MIFRLQGGVENVLALTPVLAEWKRRTGLTAKVETDFPELLFLNPYVAEVARRIEDEGDSHMELGLVRWPLLLRSVSAVYAEKVLGDSDLACWRTTMVSSSEELAEARRTRPDGKAAVVHLDARKMDEAMRGKVEGVLVSAGYRVVDAGKVESLRARRALVSVSDLFVGTDGPTAALALTTDVPAVVCHTWRDPAYFWPHRRGTPFAGLAPTEKECSFARICLANNGLSEFGKVYGCRCPASPAFACGKAPFDEKVGRALEEMFLRA